MQAVPLPAPGQPGEGYVSPTEAGRFFGVGKRSFERGVVEVGWVRKRKGRKAVLYSAHDLAVLKYLLDLGEISFEIFSRSHDAPDGPTKPHKTGPAEGAK